MCYKQLTQEERHTIYILRKEEYSVSEIVRATGRHRSTIHRELKRNTGNRGYRYHQAQRHALYCRHNSRKQIKLTESVQKNIVKKIKLRWSPSKFPDGLKSRN